MEKRPGESCPLESTANSDLDNQKDLKNITQRAPSFNTAIMR